LEYALRDPVRLADADRFTKPDDELPTALLLAKQDRSGGNLDPREYQIELFERAKIRNTIAVLDTGKELLLVSHQECHIYNLLRLRKDSDRGSFTQAHH
jgi:alpha-beta hydrolase superfamily lysophospholipase